jgi:hypothetical protein
MASNKKEVVNREVKGPTKVCKFISAFIGLGLFFALLTYLCAFDLVLPGRLFSLPFIVVIPIGIVALASFIAWLFLKFGTFAKKKEKTKVRKPWTRRETIRFIKFMVPFIAVCVLGLWIYNIIYQANYNRDLALARQDFNVIKVGTIPEKQVESTLIALEQGTSSLRKKFGDESTQQHKVYLFTNIEEMQIATGASETTSGFVGFENGQMIVVLPAEPVKNSMTSNSTSTTPRHEAVHLVFAEILGQDIYSLPCWFVEGVARYEELKGFTIDPLTERYYERFVLWRGIVPATPEQFLLSPNLTASDFDRGCYYTSYELVRYIVRTHGEEALVNIVKIFAKEKDFEKAFKEALGISPERLYEEWAQEFF